MLGEDTLERPHLRASVGARDEGARLDDIAIVEGPCGVGKPEPYKGCVRRPLDAGRGQAGPSAQYGGAERIDTKKERGMSMQFARQGVLSARGV